LVLNSNSVARVPASRMVAAGGAKRRAVPSQLEATRVPFKLEWNANNYMFASLESCVNKSRVPASRMAAAGGAKKTAASSQP
jgi:hypothetical protein